jgi:hypothetical protein
MAAFACSLSAHAPYLLAASSHIQPVAVNQYTNNINFKEAALAGQPAEGSYQSLEERVSWGILGT